MPEISKIKIIDTVYEIKDEEVRRMLGMLTDKINSYTEENEEEQ